MENVKFIFKTIIEVIKITIIGAIPVASIAGILIVMGYIARYFNIPSETIFAVPLLLLLCFVIGLAFRELLNDESEHL